MLSLFLVILSTLLVSIAGLDSKEPCAQISTQVTAGKLPNVAGYPAVSAQLGLDCLRSIPIHQKNASAFVSSIIPYVQWQSTLGYLKNPPPGYEQDPTDVVGSLTRIASDIDAGKYTNEYDYQVDIFSVVTSVKDQHL